MIWDPTGCVSHQSKVFRDTEREDICPWVASNPPAETNLVRAELAGSVKCGSCCYEESHINARIFLGASRHFHVRAIACAMLSARSLGGYVPGI